MNFLFSLVLKTISITSLVSAANGKIEQALVRTNTSSLVRTQGSFLKIVNGTF
jgi:hypothetical protein